jgi:hypothetical protein
MKRYCVYLSFIILIIGCKPEKKAQSGWSLILHLPDKIEHFVTQLPSDLSKLFSIEKSINGFNIKLSLQQYDKYTSFDVKATPETGEAK